MSKHLLEDPFNSGVTQAQAQQNIMLGFHDLLSAAGDAGFSEHLLRKLAKLRLEFLNEFEARFPGEGEGRAVWR